MFDNRSDVLSVGSLLMMMMLFDVYRDVVLGSWSWILRHLEDNLSGLDLVTQ